MIQNSISKIANPFRAKWRYNTKNTTQLYKFVNKQQKGKRTK
jgi:hypothetical protein